MKKTSSEKKRFPLNIIDVLVLLLLVAVAVIVLKKVTAVKTHQVVQSDPASVADVYKDPAELDHDHFNVLFEAVADKLDPAFAETLKHSVEQNANRINNSFSMQDAYITRVELEPCLSETGEELAGCVNLHFYIEAYIHYGDYYTNADGNFNPNLGSQDLRIGKAYMLKTMEIELSTVIVAMEVRNG